MGNTPRGYLLPGNVSVAVDTKITPAVRTISGFDKAPPRPVAALSDGRGTTISFVENELIYTTDDKAALEAFVKQWGGTVVRHLVPGDAGLRAPSQHLVRIDAKSANIEQMVSDLKKLNPGRSGNLILSSDAGLALVAIATHEAAAGHPIGINFILSSTGYSDKNLMEGMPPAGSSTSPPQGETFNRNPNQWSYFVRGSGTQNIGVGDAWRVLDQVGRLKVKVKIAVIDGGFLSNDDNPGDFTIDPNSIWAQDPNRKNEQECTNGLVCDWHGTNVVGTLMGVPNNSYGAAGPAGPVATALAIRSSGDVFNYLGSFITARMSNARIVNMSFTGGVPFLLSWAVLPVDALTVLMHDTGQMLFASAGNDGLDVDGEDCAWPLDWPCWERVWYVPCENGGVTCIGALTRNSDQKLTSSNYGSDDVALFGAGSVWVGPDLQYQDVHGFSATSAASPFVAGVAALVVVANPSLRNNEVEKILIDTANPSSDGLVRRYVNAYDAVIKALGGTPPEITIAVGVAQQFGACETLYNFSATTTDPDSGQPAIKWTSDLQNPLGTGNSFSRTLSPGTHHITATATDGTGLSTQSNEVVVTAGGAALAKRRPSISSPSRTTKSLRPIRTLPLKPEALTPTSLSAGWSPQTFAGRT
ncbi:MAG: S8/S53 family peptidase [Pyrinomonadaceae bacterium]|nr:S8/S53 family peptidase [Pyrinomonadaceae bacterium]